METQHKIHYQFYSSKETQSLEVPILICVGVFKQLVAITSNSSEGMYDYVLIDSETGNQYRDNKQILKPDTHIIVKRVPATRVTIDLSNYLKDIDEDTATEPPPDAAKEGQGEVATTISKLSRRSRNLLYNKTKTSDGERIFSGGSGAFVRHLHQHHMRSERSWEQESKARQEIGSEIAHTGIPRSFLTATKEIGVRQQHVEWNASIGASGQFDMADFDAREVDTEGLLSRAQRLLSDPWLYCLSDYDSA
eukprot:gnl/Chilomastix_cuspidata/2403.p1 GENE.gnl/Chilomastix_cuspidata/2403~~gnl/Chilomastix_cuspidata/2403.p1  ORF type:complete len:250 (+),score=85.27 gnl/Chilomastix_cuspidata/2403:108-857(+)